MAAHPDYFLEEVVDRVNETIHTHRSSGRLPNHAVDLRKFSASTKLHYRRQVPQCAGRYPHPPTSFRSILKAADRPGVIDVALEGPNQIWVALLGLGCPIQSTCSSQANFYP